MLPEINLLPKYERQSSLAYSLFIAGIIIFILLFVAIIYFYIVFKGSFHKTEQQLQQLEQQKALLEESLAAYQLDDKKRLLEQAVSYAEQLTMPTSQLIDELRTMLPPNGQLTTFRYNEQNVEIETVFHSMTDAADYVYELNESGFVKDVTIQQMSHSGEEVVNYTVLYSIVVNPEKLTEEEISNE